MERWQRRLEDLMDERFPEEPFFDMEGETPGLSGALRCECGAETYLPDTSAGEVIQCEVCGERYALATRLHLLPLL